MEQRKSHTERPDNSPITEEELTAVLKLYFLCDNEYCMQLATDKTVESEPDASGRLAGTAHTFKSRMTSIIKDVKEGSAVNYDDFEVVVGRSLIDLAVLAGAFKRVEKNLFSDAEMKTVILLTSRYAQMTAAKIDKLAASAHFATDNPGA